MAESITRQEHDAETESGLIKRAGFVLSLIALVVLALWLTPPLVFNLGVVAITTLALREFYLLDGGGSTSRTTRALGLAGGLILTLQMTFSPATPLGITIPFLVILVSSVALAKTVRPTIEELQDLLFIIFGLLYVVAMFGQLILIRSGGRGREFTALVILTVLAREIGAAAGGMLIPHSRLLNKHINPRKSYAGAAIGTTTAVGAAVLLCRYLKLDLSLTRATSFGFCLAVACQLGDLVESYMKRAVGRRHSGTLLGPEGGLLDFLDAAAFAIVVARLLLYIWGL